MLEHLHNPRLKNAITFVALFIGIVIGIPSVTAELMLAYHWIFPYALIVGIGLLVLTNILFPAIFPSNPILDYIDAFLPLTKFQSWVLPALILLLGFRLKGAGLVVERLWFVFSQDGPTPDPIAHIFLAVLEVVSTGMFVGYMMLPMSDQDAQRHASLQEQAHIRRLRARVALAYAQFHLQKLVTARWLTRRLSVKAARGELPPEQQYLLTSLLSVPTPQQQLPGPADPELRSLEAEERRATRGYLGD